MSLRLKIFLWLTPVLLPVIIVIYLNYSSQREAETEHYLKMSSLTVENGAKELNNYLRLKSTTFTLLFEELLRSAIDPVNVTSEEDIQLGMLMALNSGFSMILYTDKQAKIQYAKTAVSRSNLHLLPRDITGQTAFTRERQQLFDNYQKWKQDVSAYRQEQQRVQEQLDQLVSIGEKNSTRHNQLQQKAITLQVAVSHPPCTVFTGGKELAAAAGLPFRSDTFIFAVPSINERLEYTGFIVGILDWSIIEDICYSYKSDLKSGGIPGADIILYHALSKQFLFNQNRLSASTIKPAKSGSEKVVQYLEAEEAYLVSAPVVTSEILTLMHDSGQMLSSTDADKEYRKVIEESSDYRLTAYLPARDISFYSLALLKRSLLFMLFSVLLLIVLILLLSNRISQPITKVATLARSIAEGDLHGRLDISQDDEIGDLINSFNAMSSELQAKQSALESKNELLRISKERYQVLFDNAPIAISLTTVEGLVKEANQIAFDLTGHNLENMQEICTTTLYPIPSEREQMLQELSQNKIVRGMELHLQHKDGTSLICRITCVLLTIDGKPMIYSMFEDITEQKEAEQEKIEVEKQLQRAKKMEALGLMAGGVAHDLNNILSGIIGYPELLLADLPADSTLRKPIEAIQESGTRAAAVVADLLTIARDAASAKETNDLNILIQGYLDSPECENLKSLYPKITCQHQLEAIQSSVFCSPVHIKKCLMNLVTNAIEAIVDDGFISITTRDQYIDKITGAELHLDPGEYVVLSVRDNGPGIPLTDREHIFEPFYTRKVMGRSGTGLGLTVVWNTVNDHNGKILVDSNENGTCFQLYFPVTGGNSAIHAESINTEQLSGNGEHILVVDDEAQLRDLACQMLTSLGYNADSVSSGEQAIEFVKKNPVDLIILDMLMEPGINGRQTYEEIAKLTAGQKAIIASGFSESNDVKATLQLGAGGFIKKPYTKAQLGRAVKKELSS